MCYGFVYKSSNVQSVGFTSMGEISTPYCEFLSLFQWKWKMIHTPQDANVEYFKIPPIGSECGFKDCLRIEGQNQ